MSDPIKPADALRPTGAGFAPLTIRKTPNPNIRGCHWREILTEDGETVVAEVFAWCGQSGDKNDQAAEMYAKLFAAAPDLYEALNELEARVADYRMKHDLKGDGSPEAGRAWDLMKRAQVKARAALLQAEGR